MPYHRPAESPAPREPKPDRLLWTLHKGTDTQSAQLQDSDELGVELQLLWNDKLVYARRHESEARAAEEAAAYRRVQEADGWILRDASGSEQ